MMKRYKLLKDLPNLKKGTILSEGEPIFGVRTLITKNNGVGPTFIDNEFFEEFFKEIQEEPTDSIHWKPEYGEEYWIVNSYGVIVKRIWSDSIEDLNMYKLGIVHPTEEECEKAHNRKLAEVRLRRTSTFEPNFENRNGGWIVVYEYAHYKLLARSIRIEDAGEPVRYATREDAEKSIKENEEDWKIYFGIEEEE
jgi:hypothetical protein